MRQWLGTPPSCMCDRHLLGEHVEAHMFLGTFQKRKQIKGYLRNNCCEPESLKARHDELVVEMLRRGMRHNTPLEEPDLTYLSEADRMAKVDRTTSFDELMNRCLRCNHRTMEVMPTLWYVWKNRQHRSEANHARPPDFTGSTGSAKQSEAA